MVTLFGCAVLLMGIIGIMMMKAKKWNDLKQRPEIGSDGNTFWMCCAHQGNSRNNDDGWSIPFH
jgi:hypothetical protein